MGPVSSMTQRLWKCIQLWRNRDRSLEITAGWIRGGSEDVSTCHQAGPAGNTDSPDHRPLTVRLRKRDAPVRQRIEHRRVGLGIRKMTHLRAPMIVGHQHHDIWSTLTHHDLLAADASICS